MYQSQFRSLAQRAGGPTKRDFIDGKQYLVVPTVLLKEGVHNRVYYPEKFLKQTPQGWNGRALVLGHPKDQQGNHISANSPTVIHTQSLGSVYQSRFNKDNKSLDAETWFDEAKTEKIYPGLISRLESGGSIEESTGLFTIEDPTPGTWNGEEYDSIALFGTPDHVAALPDSIGACSLKDGCGIGYARMNETLDPLPNEHAARLETPNYDEYRRTKGGTIYGHKTVPETISIIWGHKNGEPADAWHAQSLRFPIKDWTADEAKKWLSDNNIKPMDFIPASGGTMNEEVVANVLSTARTPSFDGIESISWAGVATTFAAYRDAYYKGHGGVPSDGTVVNVKDAPPEMKSWIASKTLLGDPGATANNDLIFFPVVNPHTNHLNEGALRACISGRAAQADISQAAKDSASHMARSLLDQHFGTKLLTQENKEWKDEMVGWIKRTLARLGHNPKVNEMSMSDKEEMICSAINATLPAGTIMMLDDVYDTYAIYCVLSDTFGGEDKHYQISYSIDSTGENVTLSGSPVEVEEETTWIPVSQDVQEDKTEQNDQGKVQSMMNEKVSALIACSKTRFQESDSTWLSDLTNDQLDKLRAMDDCNTPVVNEEELANLRVLAAEALATKKAAKDKLIANIMSDKTASFTTEELEALPQETLEKMTHLAKRETTYVGQGNVTALEDNKMPAMPSLISKKN